MLISLSALRKVSVAQQSLYLRWLQTIKAPPTTLTNFTSEASDDEAIKYRRNLFVRSRGHIFVNEFLACFCATLSSFNDLHKTVEANEASASYDTDLSSNSPYATRTLVQKEFANRRKKFEPFVLFPIAYDNWKPKCGLRQKSQFQIFSFAFLARLICGKLMARR